MRFVFLTLSTLALCSMAQSAPSGSAAPSASTPAPGASSAPASAPLSAPQSAPGPAQASSPTPKPIESSPLAALPEPVKIPDYLEGKAFLFDGEKFIALESTRPAIVPRVAFIVVIILLKLPGLNADTRTKNKTPYLLISGKTAGGHLVNFSKDYSKTDPHRETALERELTIVKSDLVDFKDEKLESGWHKISVTRDLTPGEYAWIPYLSSGQGMMGVFDFGIDK